MVRSLREYLEKHKCNNRAIQNFLHNGCPCYFCINSVGRVRRPPLPALVNVMSSDESQPPSPQRLGPPGINHILSESDQDDDDVQIMEQPPPDTQENFEMVETDPLAPSSPPPSNPGTSSTVKSVSFANRTTVKAIPKIGRRKSGVGEGVLSLSYKV